MLFRSVVPYAPGGPSDVLARIYSQKLSEALGQPIIIDNKPGASGQIGAQDAARAVPDGHTLMVNASSVVILPHVMTSVLFDIEREFTPVHLMGSVPAVLIVPASAPQNTVAELVAAFRIKGGKINYSVSGAGGAMHLIAENFPAVERPRHAGHRLQGRWAGHYCRHLRRGADEL